MPKGKTLLFLSYSKNVSVVDDSSVTLSPSEVDPDATDVVGLVTALYVYMYMHVCVYLSMHALVVVSMCTLPSVSPSQDISFLRSGTKWVRVSH